MPETPAWISLLFKRSKACHALHTGFLLELTNRDTRELVDAYPDGNRLLRQVSLERLNSSNPHTLALSLIFLGVVGSLEDVSHAESFLDHSSDLVQRAAKTCCYELKQASRE